MSQDYVSTMVNLMVTVLALVLVVVLIRYVLKRVGGFTGVASRIKYRFTR